LYAAGLFILNASAKNHKRNFIPNLLAGFLFTGLMAVLSAIFVWKTIPEIKRKSLGKWKNSKKVN
jgi:hypothetical protein